MPRTAKKNTIPQKRRYSTNVKEKIDNGQHWRLQLDVDDDNALNLYQTKVEDPNGGEYVKIINHIIRLHFAKSAKKKK